MVISVYSTKFLRKYEKVNYNWQEFFLKINEWAEIVYDEMLSSHDPFRYSNKFNRLFSFFDVLEKMIGPKT